jgi:[acyl-carrier-protein] S-malonyltransferase
MSRVAFLFAGQGAQVVGMAKDFCEAHEPSRKLFARASEILNFDLAKACFEGPQETLNRTDICQPGLLVAALAAHEYFKAKKGIEATAAAGLSLGEYTALVYAGVISFEDGVTLVKNRGAWMQEACDATPSGMASVLGAEPAKIEEACAWASQFGVVGISNVNAPGQIVISGDNAALAKASEKLKEFGAKRLIPLKVAGAYHSAIMKPAEAKMSPLLDATKFSPARIPVASNIDGKLRTDPNELRDALKRQITGTVRWAQSMETLKTAGYAPYYEFGPGKVLTGLLAKCNPAATCVPIEKVADVP